MAQDDIAARMIDALDGASNLQLYQLKTLIEGMLADPKRMMDACASLHLGQAVCFVDFRSGQLRQGKVIAKHPTQATVFEEAVRRSWKIPYVSIAPAEITPGDTAKPSIPRQSRPGRRALRALHSAIGSASTTAKAIRSSAWWRRSTGAQRRSRPTPESPGASTFRCYGTWSKSESSRQRGCGPTHPIRPTVAYYLLVAKGSFRGLARIEKTSTDSRPDTMSLHFTCRRGEANGLRQGQD